MAAKLGGATYELDLDTGRFKAQAEQAGEFLKTTIAVAAGIQFQRLAQDLGQIGKEMFQLVADFDDFIVTLGSQGQVAQQTAAAVARSMLEMSQSTLFGANEMLVAVAGIAQRLETLTGRQVNVADSTAFMTAATNLAIASSSDLASSTSTLINVMLAYRIPLEEVAKASDLVFNLSRITGVEFITLALAADRLKARLGEAAPELDDLGTVLAMVNELGITGSRGLLVLVSGIDALTSGSKETNNELNRLGVGVYDQMGRFVGFRSIIGQLTKAWVDYTPEQRKASAELLFTGAAANILIGLINKGTDSFDNFNERINKTGTAATGAQSRINDLDGQVELLKNNFEALVITLGAKIDPVITKVLQAINPLLDALTESDDAMTAITIIAGGLLAAAMLTLALATYTAVAAMITFIGVSAPILLIPVAIALAIAAVVLLIKNFDAVKEWFTGGGWQNIAGFISNPFVGAIMLIIDHWGKLFDLLPEPIQNFLIVVFQMLDTLVNGFLAAARKIASAFDDLDPTGHLNTASKIPGDINFGGELQARQNESKAEAAERARQEEIAQTRRDQQANRQAAAAAEVDGGGPNVPPFTGDKAKELSKTEKDLLALAAAFAIFQAQTGGSIEDFLVFLELQKDNIELQERERDVRTQLNAATMEASNASYQLRLTWVELAEEAVRSGRTMERVFADLFISLGDKAQSLLDEILNGPTKEGTELDLRIAKLNRQAHLLERGGADEGRVDNAGKKGQPQPTSGDRQLKAIMDQIHALELEQSIRRDNLTILHLEATLKDRMLKTDANVANAVDYLGDVIINLTTTAKALDDALGGIIGTINAGLGIPQLAIGMPYVPSKMLAFLDPGEGVLTAQQNANYLSGKSGGSSGPLIQNHFIIQADMSDAAMDRLAQRVERAGDRSLQKAIRQGSMPPSGPFSRRS